MKKQTFCEILKTKRLELRLSLRAFCKIAGEDPANYSRIERGIKPPPNNEILSRYAKALNFVDDEIKKFIEIGTLFRRELPKTLSDEDLAAKLPALLRLIDGKELTQENLEKAVDISKKAFKP